MDLTEALEWAADYADRNKLFAPPMNQRGYPVDGWQNPTPAERTAIIKDLAQSVYVSKHPPEQESLRELSKFLNDEISYLNSIQARLMAMGSDVISSDLLSSIDRIITVVRGIERGLDENGK